MLKRFFFFLHVFSRIRLQLLKKMKTFFVFLLRIFGPVIVSVIDF